MFTTPASLLERLRKPHELTAWDRFVELYSPLLFHWAKHLALQDCDAADLVQEVFLILFRKLPEFDYDSSRSFRAWLRTVFLNRARQRMRERAPVACEAAWAEIPAAAGDAVEEHEYRQYLLHQALRLIEREFSPLQARAFHAYVLAGQSVEDVAREFGLSPGNLYCIKSRILNRLRHELRQIID